MSSPAESVATRIRFPPELVAYVLDHSEARVLISEPQVFARNASIRSERRHLETVYMVGSTVTGIEDFGDPLRADAAADTIGGVDQDQAAALFYTSGTTGTPKGVIHTHASLIGITQKDRTLIVLLIWYLVAFGSQVLPFHPVGAASIVLPGFEPRQTLSAIPTHRPTKNSGFPKAN